MYSHQEDGPSGATCIFLTSSRPLLHYAVVKYALFAHISANKSAANYLVGKTLIACILYECDVNGSWIMYVYLHIVV